MIRVLIVDDNEANLYLLRSLLQGNGWVVDEAHNGAEALTRARQGPPDLIISDLLMPVMDGYTLLRHWKTDEQLQDIPFVVYTATYTEPKDERLALDLGAEAFIIKPAEPEPFLARISEVLMKQVRGELLLTRAPEGDDVELSEQYREVLIHKLEQKIFQLEQVNRALQEEMTRRQQAELELRTSEEKYRAIFENASMGIDIVDELGVFRECNPALLNMLGYTQQEMFGFTNLDITHQEDIEISRQNLEDVLTGKITGYRIEKRFIRKDGTIMWGDLSVSRIRESKGGCKKVVAVIADITQRKDAEEQQEKLKAQLIQAQKMEAVGTLSGGIAHDFNNLLQAVLGYTEILIERQKPGSTDLEDLRKIYAAGKRGADLVRNLLTFSRKVQPRFLVVDLDREVMEIQRLLFHSIPKTIKIVVRSRDYLNKIMADPSQIGQIIMNLAVNARDAMPDGGTLKMETENVGLDDSFCGSHPEVEPRPWVLLTVSDTGHGMDKQIIDRIFDPFFSTKEVGKGTGLGLATVYGIVKQHNGHIICSSELGHGTEFKIYFPAIEAEKHVQTIKEETEPPRGTETILLADDEEMLRDLGKYILTSFGYQVLEAVDGQEALKIYQDQGENISLVLLDLNMPKMDGEACLTEILQLNPKARVLIATGLLEHVARGSVTDLGASGFVSKPYNIRQLLIQVREILDADS